MNFVSMLIAVCLNVPANLCVLSVDGYFFGFLKTPSVVAGQM